jgi:hypothetical protein
MAQNGFHQESKMKALILSGVLLAAALGGAQLAVADDASAWPEAQLEIFWLAPGKHENFIRKLAQWDQVSAAGGQPPTQMFIHEDGADWDVLLFKPFPKTPITPAQQAAMDAKADELHLKTGPAFFLEMRENVASHTETKTIGPVSAAQWLARLDAWRAAHPEAAKKSQ